jgi:hypothetical protein
VCRNPLLAEQRTRKREDLLQATEAELVKIAEATTRARNRLKGSWASALTCGTRRLLTQSSPAGLNISPSVPSN